MPSKQRKIAMMGYRSVGKSSLIIQFVEGQFVDSYDPTIENTFTKYIRLQSTDYEVKLVDTAGQDEYSIFPAQYSMDFHGYVLVYSITSSKSFQIVQIIYDKLLDMVGKVHVPIVLVGNKTDLHMERKISFEEGRRLAEKWKAAFLETSAKQNEVQYSVKVQKRTGQEDESLIERHHTIYNTLNKDQAAMKSVADIFHAMLCEIEKADGNFQEKSNCVVC